MQVIDKEQVLIRRPEFRAHMTGGGGGGLESMGRRLDEAAASLPELIFHVKGVDTKGLTDGARFNAKLVCIGTYHYKTVLGAGSTVPSYTVHTPLTKEQFAEALAGGLQLVSYRRVEQKKPGGVIEVKVVGTPMVP
jgi:hypothetical protein